MCSVGSMQRFTFATVAVAMLFSLVHPATFKSNVEDGAEDETEGWLMVQLGSDTGEIKEDEVKYSEQVKVAPVARGTGENEFPGGEAHLKSHPGIKQASSVLENAGSTFIAGERVGDFAGNHLPSRASDRRAPSALRATTGGEEENSGDDFERLGDQCCLSSCSSSTGEDPFSEGGSRSLSEDDNDHMKCVVSACLEEVVEKLCSAGFQGLNEQSDGQDVLVSSNSGCGDDEEGEGGGSGNRGATLSESLGEYSDRVVGKVCDKSLQGLKESNDGQDSTIDSSSGCSDDEDSEEDLSSKEGSGLSESSGESSEEEEERSGLGLEWLNEKFKSVGGQLRRLVRRKGADEVNGKQEKTGR